MIHINMTPEIIMIWIGKYVMLLLLLFIISMSYITYKHQDWIEFTIACIIFPIVLAGFYIIWRFL